MYESDGKDSANRMQRARSMLRCSLFSLIEGKVTPYFVPLQTFSLLFLQLVATPVPTGDKSGKLPQNLSCQNDYYIFSLKIFLSFINIMYLCTLEI